MDFQTSILSQIEFLILNKKTTRVFPPSKVISKQKLSGNVEDKKHEKENKAVSDVDILYKNHAQERSSVQETQTDQQNTTVRDRQTDLSQCEDMTECQHVVPSSLKELS